MIRIYIGPISYPVTGQSKCFDVSIKSRRKGDVVIRPMSEGEGALRKALRMTRAWLRLLFVLCSQKVDSVYITMSRSRLGLIRDSIFIIPFFLLPKVRIVNHLHGADFRDFRESVGPIFRRFIDIVYHRIDCAIVLHGAMVDQFEMYKSQMKLFVVRNFVEEDLSVLSEFREREPGARLDVIYLSNLIESKGIRECIDAIGILNKRNVPIRLSVYGNLISGDREGLKDMIGHNLPENVVYYGFADLGGKARALKNSDILVLPSYYPSEAFPLVALEAARFGCALVLSDWQYLPRVFSGFGARFVETRNAAAIADVLALYYQNEDILRRDRLKNFDICRTEYTEKEYISAIDRIMKIA